MPRISLTLDIDLDKPLRNAEDGRYLCASLEETIEQEWFDLILNEEVFPQSATRVCAHSLKQKD